MSRIRCGLCLASMFLAAFICEDVARKGERLLAESFIALGSLKLKESENKMGSSVESATTSFPAGEELKIAFYMTTSWSGAHRSFLKCWEFAIQKFELLQQSDLIIYTPVNISKNELEKFQGFRNTSVIKFKNQGYQLGAMLAVKEGFGFKGQQEKWFAGYDWVLRLNTDSLIVDDEWLLQTMKNKSVDAIFVTCPSGGKKGINTDFFAVRPDVLNATAVEQCKTPQYAEQHFYCCVQNILKSGRYALLPGVNPNRHIVCKITGNSSPVVHAHGLNTCCPDYIAAARASDHELVKCENGQIVLPEWPKHLR